jgi:hypothetical protein
MTQPTAWWSPPGPRKRKESSTLGSMLGMLFAMLSLMHVALGANQPPVNLGFTSFLDGVSFTPSGLVYGTNTAEYAIDRVKVGESQSISIPGQGQDHC